MRFSRRSMLCAISALGVTRPTTTAWAQAVDTSEAVAGVSRELSGVLARGNELSLTGGQSAAGGQSPSSIDLAELIIASLEKGPVDEDASNLAIRAGLLLSQINRDQHSAEDDATKGTAAAATNYPYSNGLKKEYEELYKSPEADIRAPFLNELTRVAKFITSSYPKAQYLEVETDTGVPWYVVGALHYREASFNFMAHLHNGDPLLLQTVQVPAKRPPRPWPPQAVSDPRQLWRISANDALKGLSSSVPKWSLQRMCYAFEAYNGFGYRARHVKSPYLWNYTKLYQSGGFPRDHEWSDSYVSKQAGLVAVIKRLNQIETSLSIEIET